MGSTSTVVWATLVTLLLLNLYNSQSMKEESFNEIHPELPIFGSEIPMVDSRNLFEISVDEENPEIIQFAEELRQSFHNYGFVYLSNHGIPQQLIEQGFEQSRNFFQLEQSIKSKYAKSRATDILSQYHGYVPAGEELLNENSTFEAREVFDVVSQERFYPTEELPELQIALESLEDACRALSFKLFKMVAMALQLDDIEAISREAKNLEDKNITNLSYLGSHYYPPTTKFEQLDDMSNTGQTSRCAEHTDWEVLTLLFQDDAGGLEVKLFNNEWINAAPIPGTIVVNVGDLLEIWSGGYFKAPIHRVSTPTDPIRRMKPRQSIAFFSTTDPDVLATPLPSPLISSTSQNIVQMTAHENFVKKVSSAYRLQQ